MLKQADISTPSASPTTTIINPEAQINRMIGELKLEREAETSLSVGYETRLLELEGDTDPLAPVRRSAVEAGLRSSRERLARIDAKLAELQQALASGYWINSRSFTADRTYRMRGVRGGGTYTVHLFDVVDIRSELIVATKGSRAAAERYIERIGRRAAA